MLGCAYTGTHMLLPWQEDKIRVITCTVEMEVVTKFVKIYISNIYSTFTYISVHIFQLFYIQIRCIYHKRGCHGNLV